MATTKRLNLFWFVFFFKGIAADTIRIIEVIDETTTEIPGTNVAVTTGAIIAIEVAAGTGRAAATIRRPAVAAGIRIANAIDVAAVEKGVRVSIVVVGIAVAMEASRKNATSRIVNRNRRPDGVETKE